MGGGGSATPLPPSPPSTLTAIFRSISVKLAAARQAPRGSPNHPPPPPSLLPPFLQEVAAEEDTLGADASGPVRDDGELQDAAGDDPSPLGTPIGIAGQVEEGGAATPCGDSVRRAPSSRVQIVQGAQGGWGAALLLPAP